METIERIIASPERQPERTHQILETLQRIDPAIIEFLVAANTKIYSLNQKAREQYIDASPYLKTFGVNVDLWPAPPAGLFVVSERTVYLRSTTPMTVAHELGHAFDLALSSDDSYWTSTNPDWKNAFDASTRFVSRYSETGTDEAFAEAWRAWWNINDTASPWPSVSREQLRDRSPALYALMADAVQRAGTTVARAA